MAFGRRLRAGVTARSGVRFMGRRRVGAPFRHFLQTFKEGVERLHGLGGVLEKGHRVEDGGLVIGLAQHLAVPLEPVGGLGDHGERKGMAGERIVEDLQLP